MTPFFRWLFSVFFAAPARLAGRFWLAWFGFFAWLIRRLVRRFSGQATPPATPSPLGLPADEPPDKATAEPAAADPLDASGMRDGQYSCAFGKRQYKLFVPAPLAPLAPLAASPSAPPRPLLVMLHGCKQNPADFATGTRMNALAQAAQCLVLYPAQTRWANPYGCWNWFSPQHQMRGFGEPAILAGMVQAVLAEHAADARRVYVAGLSAGAAMAVNLAHAYPELFAALGVHSGLAYGVAQDASGAMQAMKQGDQAAARVTLTVPMVVFQGSADPVVHPRNAALLLAQAGWPNEAAAQTQQGQVPSGHAYTCQHYGADSAAAVYWQVNGLGHAWSGGDAAGSFADPQGPDASAEMLRFFLAQPARRQAAPG